VVRACGRVPSPRRMEFRLLGPLEVRDAGAPLALGGGKRRALLARLLLDRNTVVPAPRLVDDLWGRDAPETAPKMVQILVSQLRKRLPDERLATRARGYVVHAGNDELDLARFERLFADGRHALAAGRPEAAVERLDDALALWRGSALAEFSEPFAFAEGARLEELRSACIEERIEAELACGRHADAIGDLETLT